MSYSGYERTVPELGRTSASRQCFNAGLWRGPLAFGGDTSSHARQGRWDSRVTLYVTRRFHELVRQQPEAPERLVFILIDAAYRQPRTRALPSMGNTRNPSSCEWMHEPKTVYRRLALDLSWNYDAKFVASANRTTKTHPSENAMLLLEPQKQFPEIG